MSSSSTAAARKLLVVFGSTGQQGGSVIKHILEDPKTAAQFSIRGITRDPSKPAAQALAAKGVECVAADLDDKQSLVKALNGADSVFAMTDYWSTMDEDREERQGRNIADACKTNNVKHLVFSTLINVSRLTKGEFKHVYHFDSKARIADYIREIGVPMTSFMPGFFMSNLPSSFRPIGKDGALVYVAPYSSKTPIPLFEPNNDTGLFVKAILTHKDETLGKEVYACTDYYTPEQILADFAKAKPKAGANATFSQISPEEYTGALASNGMPEKIQKELLENMTFMEPYGYYGKASLDWSHSLLDRKPTPFVEFAKNARGWSQFE